MEKETGDVPHGYRWHCVAGDVESIALCQVCQGWRSVAIGEAELKAIWKCQRSRGVRLSLGGQLFLDQPEFLHLSDVL